MLLQINKIFQTKNVNGKIINFIFCKNVKNPSNNQFENWHQDMPEYFQFQFQLTFDFP